MTSDELEILFERCCDSVAQPHEYRELEAIIISDPSARRRYLRTCELRQSLTDEFDYSSAEKTASPAKASWNNTRRALGLLLVAAAVLVLAIAIWPQPEENAQVASQERGPTVDRVDQWPASSNAIAKIVRKINCVWSDEAWSLDSPSEITAGQTIGLERGFMSLEFHNGVIIALEGPIKFTAIDELRGALEFGGIGVRVPQGFRGYVVDTPTAKVTDLGTEFSLRVSDDGVTDLNVIEGEVEVSVRGGTDSATVAETLVLEKDAEWSSVLGIKAPQGSPSPTDFPTAALLEDPGFDELPELPVTDELLLWLTSETAIRTDSQGGVLTWGDISSRIADERHSAWQVEPQRRPRLVQDESSGLPVIRFDGEDDCLITEPFATGDSQTVAIVGRLEMLDPQPGDVRGPQFINYNGPPNLVVEYDIFTKSVRGRVFAGYGREPRVSGQARVESANSGETLAIVYTYDHDANQALLYLNGQISNVAEARVASASTRPKVIGIHSRLKDSGLPGDLFEMLIYDRAINADEVHSLIEYFRNRYGEFGVL